VTASEGMNAVPSAMTEAARGIKDAVAELRSVSGVGESAAGRGLTQLAYLLGRSATGHDGLSQTLVDFFARWEWGLRSLVQKADGISDKLAAGGAEYQQAENSVVGLLKKVTFDAVGDPHADPAAAAGMSWDQLAAPSVDVSPESFRGAADHAGEVWSSTIADAATNTAPGMITRALSGEDPLAGLKKDVEGLSEIVG
jgi:hypothetical protein